MFGPSAHDDFPGTDRNLTLWFLRSLFCKRRRTVTRINCKYP